MLTKEITERRIKYINSLCVVPVDMMLGTHMKAHKPSPFLGLIFGALAQDTGREK